MVEDTVHKQRERIKESLIDELASAEETSLLKVEIALAALDATYPPPEKREDVPRPAMAFAIFYVVQALVDSRGFPEKVVQFGLQILYEMGFRLKGIEEGGCGFEVLVYGHVTPFVVETWWFLWEGLRAVGARGEVLRVLERGVRECYEICVGEGGSFEGVYGG